ncbi:hypothetical protein BS47DRAFT_1398835 [Hydnum rufescens UP504]|uniref:MARVEL domain-containing protein n=1 Tax=Hydnum rufescens UP504 TaxID=1448309 RepID=A0A9P6DMS1_9AGAM|nr:hypothetical protein BS47DRAFT_1398835 [Hydnum rufescens UP504]
MHIIALVRYPVFASLLLFSLIVLGIDGDLVSKLKGGCFFFTCDSPPSYPRLGVATAVLTFVSVVPLTIIDILRRGAFTSFIIVELGWFFFLWVLWLATFGDTAGAGCDSSLADGTNICSEVRAAEAFSFLAWILLFAYWVALFVFSTIAFSKGNRKIWITSARDADFSGGSGAIPGYQSSAIGPSSQQPYMTQQQQQQQNQFPPAVGAV